MGKKDHMMGAKAIQRCTLVGICALVWASALPTTEQPDCSVGGAGLCSCSELIAKKIIKSIDDCTQEAAMKACSDGRCSHSELSASTGKCEEVYSKSQCDGDKSSSARTLLGGHGGCAWCVSNDGDHQEC